MLGCTVGVEGLLLGALPLPLLVPPDVRWAAAAKQSAKTNMQLFETIWVELFIACSFEGIGINSKPAGMLRLFPAVTARNS